jgi:hypothetical protein
LQSIAILNHSFGAIGESLSHKLAESHFKTVKARPGNRQSINKINAVPTANIVDPRLKQYVYRFRLFASGAARWSY